MDALRKKISQDPAKAAALDYLDEFEGRFWCETDERIRQITEKFESQVKAQGGIDVPATVKLGAETGAIQSRESHVELVDRYQKFVNQTQLPRLNKMMSVLDEDILQSQQNFTWIVIDDLDRYWVDESLVHDLILCLFRAVVDLKRVKNLKILVALRTNLFNELDFAGRNIGQEEKFRALTLHLGWSDHDLEGMLNERVAVGARRAGHTRLTKAADVLPRNNSSRGDPMKFMLRRTLMRPRDIISYWNKCLALTSGSPAITWQAIEGAQGSYSSDRLLALRDEWKTTFPGLEEVIAKFAGAPPQMFPDKFLEILGEASLLMADPEFADRAWLRDVLAPVWDADNGNDGIEPFKGLVSILYNVGFIGIRTASLKAIFSYDQPDLLRQPQAYATTTKYIVHPTFWAALGIDPGHNRSA
ncbi:hypothetical protein VV01_20530 [Luteipulveratus halotolerans]|uniref:Uncharacterized protein n=1 Tax=Luteipulveratus halotolerans TaxID=1631356 RepID=A0A0L6CMW2_9MICO|nr:hypothetical protein VV01_20530 [Luteipulveratus halotolerans]